MGSRRRVGALAIESSLGETDQPKSSQTGESPVRWSLPGHGTWTTRDAESFTEAEETLEHAGADANGTGKGEDERAQGQKCGKPVPRG